MKVYDMKAEKKALHNEFFIVFFLFNHLYGGFYFWNNGRFKGKGK